MPAPRDVHIEIIEGRAVIVAETRPPLPSRLDQLLGSMRLTFRSPFAVTGWRSACEEREHRLRLFAEGRHLGLDGHVRDLRLSMCVDCEAVQVRDVSPDTIAGLPRSSLAPRRRDHVMGWYSGARKNQRVYT